MKLLFLDCDGTVREPESGAIFIQHPKGQRIIQGADKAIQRYHREGWTIVGITNQDGVAAGHKTLDDAIAEQRYTLEIFPEIFRIYFCPDFDGQIAYRVTRSAQTKCVIEAFDSFRKPGKGMIQLAIADFIKGGMSKDSTYLMVGDREEDKQCAAAAGIDFLWAHQWRKQYGQ